MKIKFIGSEDDISFTKNSIYLANKLSDELGGYAIKDDTGDVYRYADKYIKDNFEIIEHISVKNR